jgi:hypothetical protein
MALTEKTLVARLNKLAPAAADVQLGSVLEDLITQHNALLAALTAAALAGLNLTTVSAVKTLAARQ